jgi:uncharacterized protein (TIGR02391 family)
MKPKEAIIDLWKKGYFENIRATKEIDKLLAEEYGASSENLTAVLNNCDEFLRKMGKAGWRQRTRYEAASVGNNGKKIDYFVLLNIHPRIQKASQKLFSDGHYPSAIFEAFKQIEIMVKEKSGIKGNYGAPLMQEVFSANNPILRLNGNSTDSDGAEQKGFMMLFSGAMLGIRDPKAHSDIVQNDPIITLQYLSFASILCRMIENSTKVK